MRGFKQFGSGAQPSDTVPTAIPAQLVMVASFICNKTRGVTGDANIPILTRELAKATSMDTTPQEFRSSLQADCGEQMASMEAIPRVSDLFGG